MYGSIETDTTEAPFNPVAQEEPKGSYGHIDLASTSAAEGESLYGGDGKCEDGTAPVYSDEESTGDKEEAPSGPVDPGNHLFSSFLGIPKLPRGQIAFERRLGNGAFGEVSLGRWGRWQVAIKKIDVQIAQKSLKGAFGGATPSREDITEALQWEVARLSTVSHPNLVQFYGIYQHVPEEHTFVVMEFCPGDTLDNALRAREVGGAKRWQWAVELTQGLVYLHNKGVLHRDLKAENILIDGLGCAKLADLGVAQADSLLAETEANVVSKGLQDKRFIAPENVTNPSLSNVATDIYALGLVYWQAVSGQKGKEKPVPRFPNRDDFSGEVFEDWRNGMLLEREEIPEGCPKCFRELILACWDPEPEKRPTAAQCLSRLLAFDQSEIVHSCPGVLAVCEQLTELIHPKRIEALNYIAPYLTAFPLNETIEEYWKRIEYLPDASKDGNPPLELFPILEKFVKDEETHSLLLLGDSGLGKTLTIYLFADQILSDWWKYLDNPREYPQPPYLPIFIRQAFSEWSHATLRSEGIKKVLEYYRVVGKTSFGLLFIVDGFDECKVSGSTLENLCSDLGISEIENAKVLITCRPYVYPKEQLSQRFSLKGKLQTNYFLPFKVEQMLRYLSTQLSWNEETRREYNNELEKAPELRRVLRNPFVLNLFVSCFETLKEKNMKRLNRWIIYESTVENWLKTQQGLLNEEVLKALTSNGTTDKQHLLHSFNQFASDVALAAFQQETITLSDKAAAQLKYPWGALRDLVKDVGKENFWGYKITLVDQHTNLSIPEADKAYYCKNFPVPSIIRWTTLDGTKFYVYGLNTDKSSHLTALKEELLEGIQFKDLEKITLSPRKYNALYDFISSTNAHVKSVERRSLLSEVDYLKILEERFRQFIAGSPLKQRGGGEYEYTHKSFFEYFVAKRILIMCTLPQDTIEEQAMKLFNSRPFLRDPEVLAFWIEGWQSTPGSMALVEPFFNVMGASRNNESLSMAASNAATLIAKIRIPFSERDLCGVSIPGADLSDSFCYGAKFTDANLEGVSFVGAHLNEANFVNAKMGKVDFGLYPSLQHEFEVNTVAGSPDGRKLVVGVRSGELILHEKEGTGGDTREQLFRVKTTNKGHELWVNSVAFSPDGSFILSGSADSTLCLWDSNLEILGKVSFAEVGQLAHFTLDYESTGKTEEILAVKFSPSGKQIACAVVSTVIILDLQLNVKAALPMRNCWVLDIDYNPTDENQLISVTNRNLITIWNIAESAPLIQKEVEHSLASVAYSPDGKRIVAGEHTIPYRVNLYDSALNTLGVFLGHLSRVNEVQFAPNGVELVTCSSDSTIRLWDTKQMLPLTVLRGHNEVVHSVTFLSGDGRLVSGGKDNKVRLWDYGAQGKSTKYQCHDSWVTSVAFSPDGKTLVSGGSDNRMCFWDPVLLTALGQVSHVREVHGVTFSLDGKWIATMDSTAEHEKWNEMTTIHLWDAQKQAHHSSCDLHSGKVNGVRFNRDGHLLSGGEDCKFFMWNLETQKTETGLEYKDKITCVAPSPQKELVAFGCFNKMVLVYNTEQSVVHLAGEQQGIVRDMQFNVDGSILASAGSDDTVYLWNINEKILEATLVGHKSHVWSLAFNPMVPHQLASSSEDKTIRLWNIKTKLLTDELKGPNGGITGVNFNNEGTKLAAASKDTAVYLWMKTNEKWMLLYRFSQNTGLAAKSALFKNNGLSDRNARLLGQFGAAFERDAGASGGAQAVLTKFPIHTGTQGASEAFSLLLDNPNDNIVKIILSTDFRGFINGLFVEWASGESQGAGNFYKPNLHFLDLEEGEYIQQVEVWAGDVISHLLFTTNKTKHGPYPPASNVSSKSVTDIPTKAIGFYGETFSYFGGEVIGSLGAFAYI